MDDNASDHDSNLSGVNAAHSDLRLQLNSEIGRFVRAPANENDDGALSDTSTRSTAPSVSSITQNKRSIF